MDFWPVYILLAGVFLYTKRGSAISMLVASGIGLAHWLLVKPLVAWAEAVPSVTIEHEAVSTLLLSHSILFLLAFTWFCILDYLNLKLATAIAGAFVLFQMIMLYSAQVYPSEITFVDNNYVIIITLLNVIMMISGWFERDTNFITDSTTDLHSCHNTHKGHN